MVEGLVWLHRGPCVYIDFVWAGTLAGFPEDLRDEIARSDGRCLANTCFWRVVLFDKHKEKSQMVALYSIYQSSERTSCMGTQQLKRGHPKVIA